MRKIKITIAYEGTAFNGWQRQNNAVGIEEKVEEACKKIFIEPIKITGASRTDTGVHALGQVATFETSKDIPLKNIPYALNSKLPEDIVVVGAEVVHQDFHPRYSAIKKTYQYRIYNGQFLLPNLRKQVAFVPTELNIDLMEKACELFIGQHDFKGFSSTGSSVKTTIRTIFDMHLIIDQDLISIQVTGDGFLYNMVRIIAGTLIEVGQGKRSLEEVKEAIDLCDRNKAGKTAPAKGLTLVKIYY
ncbi:tRNA pseudouridine(38-40) synthase TruA [Vallitalea okinawensis]|uniref:tRNA pseudouridine(38-40) synthase TruA n=1 Tax=Vallitalea okinawensis TaxID=2078660 RepID=UPI000CFC40D8|nr:tRNA pseudouridine(38-40) synthase TruA [Vallitalea okinawensis]